jgi:phosphate transport system substrate-binding protein
MKIKIGIIGLNWISDGDDPKSLGFLNQIKVMSVSSKKTNAKSEEAYAPYQAYIAQKFYPLTRELFVISREARAGLGTGFASFVAGDKGQRIVLKSGLLPATMPVRIIGLSN